MRAMELLRIFADHLLPVLLTAGAGWALAAVFHPDPRPVAQTGLHVLAPCLILEVILGNAVPPSALLRMMGFAFASLAAPGALALALARWRRWPRPRTSALVLNAGLAQASLFFLASAIVSYTAGVVVASMGRAGVGDSVRGLLRMPTVWAVVVAFGMNGAGLGLPDPAASAVHLLGSACIPVFLLVLGMQLHAARLQGPLRPTLLAVTLRLAGGAAAGLVLAPLFGLEGTARSAGVVQSAMPSAVIAAILATEYDVEPGFVTSVVLLTTLLSPFTLTPLLAWLR
jgi:hypothetical protein